MLDRILFLKKCKPLLFVYGLRKYLGSFIVVFVLSHWHIVDNCGILINLMVFPKLTDNHTF